MSKKELFKQLNSLCSDMSLNYNINCGGCCYVAAVIAEQLEKVGLPFQVGIAYEPCHYAIKVSDRCINRDGFKLSHFYSFNSEYLYTEYYREDWNETYNRKWNLIVKTRISALFRKYGNNI